jgi:hypothetical protein
MPAPDAAFPNEALLGRLVACVSGGVTQPFSIAVSDSKSAAPSGAGQWISSSSEAAQVQVPLRPVFPPRLWTLPIGWLLCHVAPARSLALRIHELRRPEQKIPHAPLRTTDLEAS